MPKKWTNSSQPASIPTVRRKRLAQPVEHRGLERLRKRFEEFRSTNSLTTEIPVSLRKAVLAILQKGVTRSAVQKSCGVSWTQMNQWKEVYGPQPKMKNHALSAQPARVLSVVDDGSAGMEPPTQPLELRLGDWSITVRQTGNIQ